MEKIKRKLRRVPPSFVHRAALELLDKPTLRLKLILSELLSIMILMPALLIPGETAAYIAIGCLAVFVIFPLSMGRCRMVWNAMRDEEVYITDAFRANTILPRTWLIIFIGALPFAGYAGVGALCTVLWRRMSEFAIVEHSLLAKIVIYGAVIAVGVCGVMLLLAFSVRCFFIPAYAMRTDVTLKEAILMSIHATNGRMWETFCFILSFFGWFILGCISFGVVMILHTIPYFSSAYMIYAEECSALTETANTETENN